MPKPFEFKYNPKTKQIIRKFEYGADKFAQVDPNDFIKIVLWDLKGFDDL